MPQQTDHIGDTNKMVTAVEWLFIQLYERFEMKGDGKEMNDILEQAKAMEKEQIIDAFDSGTNDENRIGREYYNEIYVK
jgi:hypothetical protein